ncbi:hypothetical protein J5N97_020082 [Dioscorea zingiberensis]|uniref:BZIP domain-containing protein n=1 Tax=Dioscorea zingiberensis TaxID=325984 RepID=A0A9D5HDH2_9LILI|nr:hypothetical protein J5N97_020082 [Dioscorea zingiberensis]
MANAKGTSNLRNPGSSGKQSFLPPKSPFPTISPSYADYGASSHSVGSKGVPKPREGHRHHQRTTSESFLIDEQPSWLDDLLNEPETPVKRGGHRRSSSDSFAYLDVAGAYSNLDNVAPEVYNKQRPLTSAPSWGSEDFDNLKDMQHGSFYPEAGSFLRPQNRVWESALNTVNYPSNHPSPRDKNLHQGSSCAVKEPDTLTPNVSDKQNQVDSSPEMKSSSDRKEVSQPKNSQTEVDPKRVKQQFAQRSRVRKLQYIAELERHVQALQAKRSEVSAELEFLDQQNLILNLENKTLKQRLDSLQQEQLIKCFQHEMLEREVARLRSLYFQHQQPQQPASTHVRSNSRDLDSQFANLSLKHKEASSGRDSSTGPLRI